MWTESLAIDSSIKNLMVRDVKRISIFNNRLYGSKPHLTLAIGAPKDDDELWRPLFGWYAVDPHCQFLAACQLANRPTNAASHLTPFNRLDAS